MIPFPTRPQQDSPYCQEWGRSPRLLGSEDETHCPMDAFLGFQASLVVIFSKRGKSRVWGSAQPPQEARRVRKKWDLQGMWKGSGGTAALCHTCSHPSPLHCCLGCMAGCAHGRQEQPPVSTGTRSSLATDGLADVVVVMGSQLILQFCVLLIGQHHVHQPDAIEPGGGEVPADTCSQAPRARATIRGKIPLKDKNSYLSCNH